jgi:HD-GYP domain-containing protein (c-di-GMP phosphodiesterase class II)/CHASE1-domain containing sensor protein
MAHHNPGKHARLWLRRTTRQPAHFFAVLTILGIGVAMSFALFFVVHRWEHDQGRTDFEYAATHPVEAVRRAAERIELVHEAVREFFYGGPNVTRDGFATTVVPFFPHAPSLRVWHWAPRIFCADRNSFEESARREGLADFQVTEPNAQKRIVRAGERDEYFPVWYAVSQTGDQPPLGWDVASTTAVRSAMEQSRDSDALVTTGVLHVSGEDGEETTILTLLPVYRHPQFVFTVEDRRRELAGFLVCTCAVGRMVEYALSYDTGLRGIDMRVFDQSAQGGRDFLYLHASRTRKQGEALTVSPADPPPESIHYSGEVTYGKRRWSLACTPAPSFFTASEDWRSWTALGGGLFLTALTAAYAWSVTRRRERIERLVERRTQRIRSLDEQLRQSQEAKVKAIRLAQEETIHRLVRASLCRDEETGMHIKRTGLLSESLAQAAGWSENDAEIIRLAAPMHDVGKIGIPDAVLRKPGKLMPAEYDIMKTHTLIGAKMLEGSLSSILSMAHDIALCHHERWDGRGYPQGLSGLAIPEAARILSIVDVFDALSHDRVYRAEMPDEEVLQLMSKGVGTQFDPALLAVFFAHYEELRRIAQENPDESATERGMSFLLPVTPVGAPMLSPELDTSSTLASTSLV